MKFGQLPVGTRFDYEGVHYLKTGPLVAAPEDGGQQRFLGRYADVRVLAPVAAKAQPSAATDWRIAFDVFFAECLSAVNDLGAHDPRAVARARSQLEAARDRMLAAITGSVP